MKRIIQAISVLSVPLLSACADNETGRVQLFVEAEDTLSEGLDPGDDLENITDGWTVRYSKVLMALGNVKASSSSSGDTLRSRDVHLLDLTRLPSSGFVLLDEQDVPAVRFDKLSYDNPSADDDTQVDDSVRDADAQMMIDEGYALYIEGAMTKDDGQSCNPATPDDCVDAPEVHFAWGISEGTSFQNCAPEDGDSGFAVAAGSTTSAAFTLHGDHWFFNGFPDGTEIVERQAQWVADADLDRDGTTSMEELQSIPASDLFPSSRYSLAGSPIPISTAYDFLVAEAHTLGHFQGEGECEVVVLTD